MFCEGKMSGVKKGYCQEGCGKRASFNIKGFKGGVRCGKHKTSEMIDVVHRRCEHDDCTTIPTFNKIGETKARFCKDHALPEMIDVISRRCEHKDCATRSTFNKIGETKARFCKEHALPEMIDVVSRKCEHYNCTTIPTFNKIGETKARFCKEHALPEMIDVVSRRCEQKDCVKQPAFNKIGETKRRFCKDHALPEMIDVVSHRCEHDKCMKIPAFNKIGETKGRFCKDHALPEMIDVVSRRCEHDDCTTRPTFNKIGETKARFCKEHALPEMIDVRSPRCLSDFCDTIVTRDTNNGYCLHCYIHLFPDQPVARNYKTKEKCVVDFITQNFSHFTWISDKRVQDGCSKRRPDLICELGYQVLIVEVDENQHINYDCSCENKRLMEISQDVGHRPLVFIRFNPDDYIIGEKKVTSCWTIRKNGVCGVSKVKSKAKEWEARLCALKSEISYWTNPENITDKTVEVVQLFFDQ